MLHYHIETLYPSRRKALRYTSLECFYMVGLPGFEPGPGGLKVRCAKPLTLQSHIGP